MPRVDNANGNPAKGRDKIAALLGEVDETPLAIIASLIKHWGARDVEKIAREAVALEAGGGLLTRKKQRRTLGGVFFKLAKKEAKQRGHAWNFVGLGSTGVQAGTPARKKLTWEDISAHLKTIAGDGAGEVMNMRLSMVAKPEVVIPYDESCVLVMLNTAKSPALPKRLPAIKTATKFAVFVAVKQWRKIEKSFQENPRDQLIVEGVPIFDPSFPGVTILAISVRSKKMEKAKREAKQAG